MKSKTNRFSKKLRLISGNLFTADLSKIQNDKNAYLQSRRFFELSTCFFYLIQNFSKAEEHFAILSYFYENCKSYLPASDIESKVISLRLVYLYSSNLLPEFFSLKSSLSVDLKNTSDFKNLEDFVYFLEIGNFTSALNSIAKISPVHKSILSQIEDSHKES